MRTPWPPAAAAVAPCGTGVEEPPVPGACARLAAAHGRRLLLTGSPPGLTSHAGRPRRAFLWSPISRGRRPSVLTTRSGRVARRRQDATTPVDGVATEKPTGPSTGVPCHKGAHTRRAGPPQ